MRFDPETHTLYAAGRKWPSDPSCTVIQDLDAGRFVTHIRRCRVRFESGWSASIIWGSNTYSSNHDVDFNGQPLSEEPATVEVGVCDRDGELRMRVMSEPGEEEWHDLESYLDDEQLATLLDRLERLPTDYDYGEPPPTSAELHEAYTKVADAVRQTGRELPEWPG